MRAKEFKRRTLEIIDSKIDLNVVREMGILESINYVLPVECRRFTTGTQIRLIWEAISKEPNESIRSRLIERENLMKANEELLKLRKEIEDIC